MLRWVIFNVLHVLLLWFLSFCLCNPDVASCVASVYTVCFVFVVFLVPNIVKFTTNNFRILELEDGVCYIQYRVLFFWFYMDDGHENHAASECPYVKMFHSKDDADTYLRGFLLQNQKIKVANIYKVNHAGNH